MAVDLTKLHFDSRENYLKRSEFVGTTTINMAAVNDTYSYTVTHDLGYIPFFVVGAEQVGTTVTWSNNYVHEGTRSAGAPDLPPQLTYECSTTELTINLHSGTGAKGETGDRDVYWAIYLDYST